MLFSSKPATTNTDNQGWWNSAIENNPYLLVLGLWLTFLPLILLLVWLKLNSWEKEQINLITAEASHTLDLHQQQAAQDIDSVFTHLKGLPEFLSLEPKLTLALDNTNQDTVTTDAANRYLKNIARYLSIDLAFLMNTDGLCIAANNFDSTQSLIGVSYQDRGYFKDAMQGRFGGQYALGRVTNIPGLYFSAPIRNIAGTIIGVVAIKIDLPKVTNRIRLGTYFLTDNEGVIIAASDSNLIFKILPNAAILSQSEDFQQKRYKRTRFEPLILSSANIEKHPTLQYINGQKHPVFIREIERSSEGFTAYLVEPLSLLTRVHEQGFFVVIIGAAGALAALWALIASIIFLLRARLYRKKIQQSHDELMLLNARLKHQAETDFLTGCMNRRHFDQTLKMQLSMHQQNNMPLSLALFDIDFFKRINDSFGHDIGDKVLQHICQLTKALIGPSDILARLGGEEFTILMPNTDRETAHNLMEALRSHIAQTPLLFGELLPIPTTISIGITDMIATDTAGALLHRADDGMYRAKGSGRNQVVTT